MKKHALLLCLSLGSSLVYAAPSDDVVGKTYQEARAILMQQGFKPLTRKEMTSEGLIPADKDMPPPGESEMIGKGYEEVESCTGSGIPKCQFVFKNTDSSLYRTVVYTPEGGAPTRIEEFTFIRGGKAKPGDAPVIDLAQLQLRIGMTNKNRKGIPFTLLGPCDAKCITAELYTNMKIGPEFPKYYDPVSTFNIMDLRKLQIVELHARLKAIALEPLLLKGKDKSLSSNELAYVIDQVTLGAVEECVEKTGGIISCSLVYKDQYGYIYKVTAIGSTLANFNSVDVALVNGQPKFSEYSPPQLTARVKKEAFMSLYASDKSLFRLKMREEFKGSKREAAMYASAYDTSAYTSRVCDIIVSQAYWVLLNENLSEDAAVRTIQSLGDSIYKARCAVQ